LKAELSQKIAPMIAGRRRNVSTTLRQSGCNVYFIDRCTDLPGGEFRIVAIAETPAD
jgi:hypothetical protein